MKEIVTYKKGGEQNGTHKRKHYTSKKHFESYLYPQFVKICLRLCTLKP